jgi:hypothetical protein
MALRRWFGYRFHSGLVTDPSVGMFAEFSLNIPNIANGDKLSRSLIGYRVETELLDNGSGLEKPPFPLQFAVNYTPVPDGETSLDAGGVGGDALFRDFARWQPQAWTDGSLFATKWFADSGGLVSVQGTRTVVNKTLATITFQARGPIGDPGFSGPDYNFVSYKGFMWGEFLFER